MDVKANENIFAGQLVRNFNILKKAHTNSRLSDSKSKTKTETLSSYQYYKEIKRNLYFAESYLNSSYIREWPNVHVQSIQSVNRSRPWESELYEKSKFNYKLHAKISLKSCVSKTTEIKTKILLNHKSPENVFYAS